MNLVKEKFLLNNGSYLILEQTSAFLTIDVNSGSDLKIGAKEINLMLVMKFVELIKVLGFGGKILLIFCHVQNQIKKKYMIFFLFFFDDMSKNKIWGWTKGGIFELERETR